MLDDARGHVATARRVSLLPEQVGAGREGRRHDRRDPRAGAALRHRTGWPRRVVFRSAPRRSSDVADELPPPEQGMCDAEIAIAVQAALNDLPDRDRKLVVNWMYEGGSITKAGRISELKKSQACERFKAALGRLRVTLEAYRPDRR